MYLKNILVCLSVAFFVQKSQAAHPSVPCPDVFRYARLDGEYFGIVTVNDVDYGDTVLDIKLSQPEQIDSGFYGKISLNFDINESAAYIESGDPFVYKVQFALENVLPKVQSIKVNGVQICSRNKKIPLSDTTVDLQHTLTVPFPLNRSQRKKPKLQTTKVPTQRPTRTTKAPISPSPQNNLPSFLRNTLSSSQMPPVNIFDTRPNERPWFFNPPVAEPIRTFTTAPPVTTSTTSAPIRTFTTTPPVRTFTTAAPIRTFTTTPPTRTTTRTTVLPFQSLPDPNLRFKFIEKPNQEEWKSIDRVCGRENFDNVNNLVVNGTVVPKARFPWIVAIYKKSVNALGFQCGGSLITTRTVISAAHCFYSGVNEIYENNIVISLGRHYLDDWSDSSEIVNSNVEKIIKHPDYKVELENNDADIAIVQLTHSVAFTVYIRPVCMWEGILNVEAIEGVSGIVVGWGRDEYNNDVTRQPRLATASVVSESTCLKSNESFHPHTSNRTLCAGDRNGSGPCKGDSGSGLMIKVKNKWRLRGTVSVALRNEENPCDLKQYVVYTDVAQFLGWIYTNSVF